MGSPGCRSQRLPGRRSRERQSRPSSRLAVATIRQQRRPNLNDDNRLGQLSRKMRNATPRDTRHSNSNPRNNFGLVSPKMHQATPGDTRQGWASASVCRCKRVWAASSTATPFASTIRCGGATPRRGLEIHPTVSGTCATSGRLTLAAPAAPWAAQPREGMSPVVSPRCRPLHEQRRPQPQWKQPLRPSVAKKRETRHDATPCDTRHSNFNPPNNFGLVSPKTASGDTGRHATDAPRRVVNASTGGSIGADRRCDSPTRRPTNSVGPLGHLGQHGQLAERRVQPAGVRVQESASVATAHCPLPSSIQQPASSIQLPTPPPQQPTARRAAGCVRRG
jgi:hypothetical protein